MCRSLVRNWGDSTWADDELLDRGLPTVEVGGKGIPNIEL